MLETTFKRYLFTRRIENHPFDFRLSVFYFFYVCYIQNRLILLPVKINKFCGDFCDVSKWIKSYYFAMLSEWAY